MTVLTRPDSKVPGHRHSLAGAVETATAQEQLAVPRRPGVQRLGRRRARLLPHPMAEWSRLRARLAGLAREPAQQLVPVRALELERAPGRAQGPVWLAQAPE